jgi:hypothetical protein
MDVSGQLHALAVLSPGKGTRYSFDRRLSGPQSRSGRGGEGKKPCPCRESIPGRPARSLVTSVRPTHYRSSDQSFVFRKFIALYNLTSP